MMMIHAYHQKNGEICTQLLPVRLPFIPQLKQISITQEFPTFVFYLYSHYTHFHQYYHHHHHYQHHHYYHNQFYLSFFFVFVFGDSFILIVYVM